MESTFYLVKFFGRNREVVHDFVIKTCNITRVLDVCRSWLVANNFKCNNREVVGVECETLFDEGVL